MSEDKSGQARAHVVSHQQFVDALRLDLGKGRLLRVARSTASPRSSAISPTSSAPTRAAKRRDGPVIARGINSVELFYDGKRWWIASNIWDDERPDNPLPAEYLAGKPARK